MRRTESADYSIFDASLYRNLELMWRFSQEKPPCTPLDSARVLENRSNAQLLRMFDVRGTGTKIAFAYDSEPPDTSGNRGSNSFHSERIHT